MPNLYYAAPLFTEAERCWNLVNAQVLRTRLPSWRLHMPQEFCAAFEATKGADGKPDYRAIFSACVAGLDQCDAVFAVLDGADADSGTSWEIGYAFARNIPVIGLRTDWRPGEDGAANAMLTRSCYQVCWSLDEAVEILSTIHVG